MNRSPRALLAVACRLLLAALFLWAASLKIRDPAAFALAVSRYHILPGPLVNPVAILLPWVEILSALALLLPSRPFRAAGAALIASMLAVFTLAIAWSLLHGTPPSCGCFSLRPDAAPSNAWNLLRNAALLLAAFLALDDALSPVRPLSPLRTKFRIPLS